MVKNPTDTKLDQVIKAGKRAGQTGTGVVHWEERSIISMAFLPKMDSWILIIRNRQTQTQNIRLRSPLLLRNVKSLGTGDGMAPDWRRLKKVCNSWQRIRFWTRKEEDILMGRWGKFEEGWMTALSQCWFPDFNGCTGVHYWVLLF